ncbi:MAG: hypothetical protein QMD05_02355 [Candidatus Brocadiaceae bacterium]|nr:hypothetical protein [Candidatus Brocadiaceae bacterium]
MKIQIFLVIVINVDWKGEGLRFGFNPLEADNGASSHYHPQWDKR